MSASDLPKIYNQTAEALSLAPSQHTEPAFKAILGSCYSVVNNLGTLRNKIGDAHGRGRPVKVSARHAALAVNLAGAIVLFLIETRKARRQERARRANDPIFLAKIKERLPLSTVVRRRVQLKRAGREWKGLSPFQSEETPSFYVNVQKEFYHCFATGNHGDLFSFVVETGGVSMEEAVEQLAAEAGVTA